MGRKFFQKNQLGIENFDQFMTELRNLVARYEFGELQGSLLLYKVVNGIKSDKIRTDKSSRNDTRESQGLIQGLKWGNSN